MLDDGAIGKGERVKVRVLVVEDDPSIRVLIRILLTRHEIAVDEAKNGSEAIQLLAGYEYPLVLLDLMLPLIDGYQLLDLIASKGCARCVILMTAATDQDLSRIDPGMIHSVVRKPFDIHELQTKVLDVLKIPNRYMATEDLPPATPRQAGGDNGEIDK